MNAGVYSTWCIYTDGKGKVLRCDYETNDDNDDGRPEEVVRASYYPVSLKAALLMAGGGSHDGAAGHKVTVFIDGEKI